MTRAPLRISYIGGGSDYPNYFREKIGNVVGATFNSYSYVYVNPLASISSENIRFSYRVTESVSTIDEINHPVVREALKFFGIRKGLNLGTFSDLPSGTGLGGSSAFSVALISAISGFNRNDLNEEEIARLAIRIERVLLKEQGGWQDQLHATFGGMRHYSFTEDSFFTSEPLVSNQALSFLSDRHLLIYSGYARDSRKFAEITTKQIDADDTTIAKTSTLAAQLANALKKTDDHLEIYSLLVNTVQEGWELKKQFTAELSEDVNSIIDSAFKMKVDAVKLLGAGRDGFVLCLGDPGKLLKLKNKLGANRCIDPMLLESGVETLIKVG